MRQGQWCVLQHYLVHQSDMTAKQGFVTASISDGVVQASAVSFAHEMQELIMYM